MRITRRTARVCGQDASTATFAAVRATSLVSWVFTFVNALVVKSPDYPANRQLLSGRDTPKFNPERIWSSVMNDLSVQSQSVFLVNQ
jgi:hypothetical protein